MTLAAGESRRCRSSRSACRRGRRSHRNSARSPRPSIPAGQRRPEAHLVVVAVGRDVQAELIQRGSGSRPAQRPGTTVLAVPPDRAEHVATGRSEYHQVVLLGDHGRAEVFGPPGQRPLIAAVQVEMGARAAGRHRLDAEVGVAVGRQDGDELVAVAAPVGQFASGHRDPECRPGCHLRHREVQENGRPCDLDGIGRHAETPRVGDWVGRHPPTPRPASPTTYRRSTAAVSRSAVGSEAADPGDRCRSMDR